MAKAKYFNPKDFVNKVIADSHLGDVDEKTRSVLEDAVQRRLAERITATIINQFNEKEFVLLEKILDDHPELDEIDAISVISSNIPGLQDKLGKAVTDLYEEITYDAGEIQKSMDMRKAAETVKL
jgi:hypothetical protein